MKHIFQRGLLLAAFILGIAFHLAAQSTQVVVVLNDGTEQSFQMSENDRLYFEDNTRLVIEENLDKSVTKFNLAEIRKLTCSQVENTVENSEQSVYISPNPVHNELTLNNLSGKQVISVYAVDGRLMKTFEAISGQRIDVSELPIGLYLVKTQTRTFKMIKL